MAMADVKSTAPDVNLLPDEDLTGRPGGIFLKWALTWGKRIVVTTELIVILAFLSRFWLDTQVANLSEKIEQKKAIVLSESEFETTFRALSSRIDKSKSIEKLPSPLALYNLSLPLIPPGVVLSKITLDGESIFIAASSDELSLGKMVDGFKNSPGFADVSVGAVSRSVNGAGVDFSLSANLADKKRP